VRKGYAPVNGLEMYYEVHGEGRPLLLLHGAFMVIEGWGSILGSLAQTRQIVAVEVQGHGHTADVDRPLTYEQLADDAAALLGHLGISEADVLGYSMGGATALQVGIRHPDLVRRLVVVSAGYSPAGNQPELLPMMETITADAFAGSPWLEMHARVAPRPGDFPTLVEKVKAMEFAFKGWPADDVRSMRPPTMVVVGDSDAVQLEHAVETYRLLGGGAMGDLVGLPASRLAVLPGTHHVGVIMRGDLLVHLVAEFLDAPDREG
jgi:pimeloyl-ACP methyl ester carboxylesterase